MCRPDLMNAGCIMKPIKNRWPVGEQAEFLEKLGEMMMNGYTLLDALSMLELQLKRQQKRILHSGGESLRKGILFFKF